MNVLEFISSVVGALAWPTVALVILWRWNEPLAGIMSGDVRRLKAGPGGVELEFWEDQTESIRESLEDRPGQAVEHEGEASWESIRFAEAAPAGAIIEAFGRVEETLTEILGAEAQRLTGWRLAQTAYQEGVIDERQFGAIRSLSKLRNVAAHPRSDMESPTASQAIEYLELADWVVSSLLMSSPGPMPEHDLG